MPLPPLDIFEKMRGIYTPVIDIRRRVLAEVAAMIVKEKPLNYVETIPYNIIDQNTPTYRCCVFRERAIVRERVRLAMGLDLKEFGAHAPILDDVEPALKPTKVITPPIVNVIKVGCERCPEHSYFVSNLCRGCMAHPCTSVCPKKAVSIIDGKSVINQDLCIRCGKCAQVCPYNAIAYRERPCAAACGVNAISSDAEGYAEIDYEKCVSCGMCIVSCPFGAIAEKSEIVQIINGLKSDVPVYAEIAPSFVGQFGPLVNAQKLFTALQQIGFQETFEVAYGADVDVLLEVEELIDILECKEKPEGCERDFVGTSCCPGWVSAARKNYPELSQNISESFTPMVETAKKIKLKEKNAKIVFIGPCIAKKMECFDPNVAEYVDFVMTFEELAALFYAYNIDPSKMTEGNGFQDKISQAGRNFPVAGGVAKSVIDQTKALYGHFLEIPTASADTLEDCMQLLKNFKQKRLDPMPLLVEGMACPYGCIGGPGTLAPLKRAQREVSKYAGQSEFTLPNDYLPYRKIEQDDQRTSKKNSQQKKES